MYKFTGVFFGVFFLITNCYAGDLTAQVKNTSVNFFEPFDYTVSYEGDDGYALRPDFSELDNDFTISSTSSSVQSSFINGKGSVNRTWRLKLLPKRTGKIVIPAVKAGNYSTQPIEITVSANSVSNNMSISGATVSNNALAPADEDLDNTSGNTDFAIDVQVDTKKPYVQQEVNVVLTIRDPRGLELTSEPLINVGDDWIVKMLKQPTVNNNGRGLREIKFYYAFFPQKSGLLTIPPLRIEGFYMSVNSPQNDSEELTLGGLLQIFDFNLGAMFGTRQPVVLQSKPIEIDVKPLAEGYGNNWWLPSGAVGLAARWSETNPVYKVGETVTREVLLTAEGVADTQLPELALISSPDIKQYPEKPEVDSIIDNGKVTSRSLTRIVYIPQKSGQQVIPEIRVPWFNVETQTIETAVVPAETVTVQSADITGDYSEQTEPQTAAAPSEIQSPSTVNRGYHWLWIVLAFLAGIGISFALFRRKEKSAQGEHNVNDWQKAVIVALKENDIKALRDSLIQGGREIFSESKINNLTDLDDLLQNKEFSEQIQNLNNRLYNNANVKVDGKLMLSILKKYKQPRVKKKIADPLPDLYK